MVSTKTSQAGMRRVAGDGLFLLAWLPVVLGLALIVNSLRPNPLPLFREAEDRRLAGGVSKNARDAAIGPLTIIDLEGALAAQSEGEDVWVDAREAAFYGLGHVPGARNLPRKDFERQFAAFQREVPAKRKLIVYCSGPDCEDAAIVARTLVRLGYENIRLFAGGWEEWQAAGLPEER